MQELIIVKQLPVIEENLKALKAEVETKANRAKSLVVTEESVKEVKGIRADLNKEFAELENQRKLVKAKVLEPYEAFEKVYKECVADSYKAADKTLKEKVDEVEDSLRKEKEGAVVAYFNEYRDSLGIDFVDFNKIGITITLSASLKSLKDQAKAFVDKVCDDLELIKTQEYQDEIFVEYKSSLNVSQAITTVANRKKALQEMEERKQKQSEAEVVQQQKVEEIDKIVELAAPVAEPVIEEKKFKATFEVKGTIDQLKGLKAYMEREGIEYVSR